jgi:hypothetical protein
MNVQLIKAYLVVITIILVTSCAQTTPFRYKKAIVDVSDIKEAINLQEEIDSREGIKPPEGSGWFEIEKGSIPFIVTAPHATRPYREGEYRFSDGGGTAALAYALHKICSVTAIYTTYEGPSDPNYYDDNEFKEALGAVIDEIKPIGLIDIHGSNSYRPYEVDIGTMNGKSLLGDQELLDNLIKALYGEGITNISDNWFAASKNQTVTKFSANNNIPAMQLEISAVRLNPSDGNISAHLFSQTLQGLIEFLMSEKSCALK